MKTAQRLTPADRNRAIERLRVLTAGATILGVSATIGFSWLAALSHPGVQVSASTTGTTTTGTTTIDGTGSVSNTSTSNNTFSGGTFGSTSIGNVFGGGTAHISTGGS